MQNFVYHNPVRVIFGRGTIPQIGGEVKPFGKTLLVYGQGSSRRNGVYDQVVTSLKEAGVTWVEFGGVRANPVLSHTRDGIALARAERVESILAVGGGSVIDEAKAIAFGAATNEYDVWEVYARKAQVTKALPLLTVLTMSATGTEMNGGTVITNESTRQKLGYGSPHLYPRVSILDPEVLYTIPATQSAYGAIDAACHLMESYFTAEDANIPLQDRYVEGIVRTLTEIAAPMIASPRNYDLRATFMWAATLAWNGTAPAGVGNWGTPNHLIGHAMSALCDTPHGESLAIALSGWMPWFAETTPRGRERITKLGRGVFDASDDVETIERFRNWFRSLNVATTLAGIGVNDDAEIAANVAENAPLWGLPDYANAATITTILRRCE
ncbi:MAG: iron-containing alcohol dehydrogenase [Thermoguttaceae bacterium]